MRSPVLVQVLHYDHTIEFGVLPPSSVKASLHENEEDEENEDVTAVPQEEVDACCSLSGAHGNQCLLYVEVGREVDGEGSLGNGGGELRRVECWLPVTLGPSWGTFFVCTYF